MQHIVFKSASALFLLRNNSYIAWKLSLRVRSTRNLSVEHKQRSFTKKQLIHIPTMRLEGVKACWDSAKWKPEDILSDTDKLIERIRAAYNRVGSLSSDEITFENVIKAIDDTEREFQTWSAPLVFAQNVATDKAVRDASVEADRKLDAFEVEMSMRKDVFDNVVAFEKKHGTDNLKPEAKRFVERLITLGKRNGLHLSDELQEQVKSIKKQMSKLCIMFSHNLNEVTTELAFSEDQLLGLPQDFINSLQKDKAGKRIVTLKYPHIMPVTRKCKVSATRRELETAYQKRCMKENTDILEELIRLRQKQANLLGYPNHASYIQEIRMARNPEAVDRFLMELAGKLKILWEKEKKAMLKLKKEEAMELNEVIGDQLDFWDIRYYMTMIEEKLYSVDEEKLREYFPLNTVTKGLLEIYQGLLGLKFTEMPEGEKWHEDVQIFMVEDASSGKLMGYFYLDLYPRDGKFGHAGLFKPQHSSTAPGSEMIAVGAMVANFTKPTADKPALLDHREVETYFHEFGHVMHFICSETEYAKFNGTRVEADFLEAPSQTLENWVWEKEPLKMMSGHYKDGSPLPDDMIDKLILSKQANAGIYNLRQIVLAKFDQMIHTRGEADTQKVYADLFNELLGITVIPGTNMPASFEHLAGGYDAQYYGYLWSEVFSKDMFESRFKKEGILNPKVGMDYRKCILQPGGSIDASEMLSNFLGRDPTPEAFLRSKGLPSEGISEALKAVCHCSKSK